MFNRYWRSYPWYFQLVQFIILIAVLASFFLFALTPIVLKLQGVALQDVVDMTDKSPRRVIDAALIIQFLTACGIFLLPALLFAYFTHPRPGKYLGLTKPGKSLQWVLVPVVMLGAAPLFLGIAEWISHFDLGAGVKKAQEENDRAFSALLSMSSPGHFIAAFLVLAILPGLSEELFFRGVIMKFVAKRSRSILPAIVFSSVMFALLHSNIYGMVSIFLAGMLLAAIYYLTGSLWCSIIAHIFYNGMQVILSYAANYNDALKDIGEKNVVPLSWILGGAVLFAVSFYLLWKNRTPLEPSWTADYSLEELREETPQ